MQAGHGCGQLLNFKTFLPLDRCVHVSVPVWRGGGGGGLLSGAGCYPLRGSHCYASPVACHSTGEQL